MNANWNYRMQRMGSIDASSTGGTSAGMGGNNGNTVANSGGSSIGSSSSNTNWTNVAQSAASLANTGQSIVKGVLQAEAAQNAINAQRNFTTALTPGVITAGLALLAYFLIVRK